MVLWQGGCESSGAKPSDASSSTDGIAANPSSHQASDQTAGDDSAARSADQPATAVANPGPPEARPLSPQELPTPPGVDRQRLLARQGDSLTKAKQSLKAILASLPEDARSVLPSVATQPATTGPATADAKQADQKLPADDNLPRAAQIAYITGRVAMDDRRMQTAILQFKIALGLAPHNADIARALAQAYLRIGNRPAASMYLQRALQNDPNDLDSLIKLGRSALERGQWDQALFLFDRAAQLARQTDPVSPALEQICAFYLGSSLEIGGYDQASIEQYLASMAGRKQLTDTPAAQYQMSILQRQFGMVWQAVGDARLRLGKPKSALQAYNRAATAGVSDINNWLARYVYTELLLGYPTQATTRTAAILGEHPDKPVPLPLVQYLVKHGGNRAALAQLLQKIYTDSDQTMAMAQSIGSLLPVDTAREFLIKHLKHRPSDLPIARQLIQQILANSPAQSTGNTQAITPAVAALKLTVRLIKQSPTQATAYAQTYLDALDKVGKADDMASLIKHLPATQQHASIVRYISTIDLLRDGSPRQARSELEAITRDDPAFMPARLMLATQLAGRAQWADAQALIQNIHDEPWRSEADQLMVSILEGLGKHSQAQTLLDDLIRRSPGNVKLSIHKAAMLAKDGKPVEAERTLLDLLNAHPRNEIIYKALFDLYDQGDVPDATTQYQRLMVRMFQTIPQSRVARLQQVEMLMVRREMGQAEDILRGLLKENPKDYVALGRLAALLRETSRADEADKLVDQGVEASPKDARMLAFAAQYYQTFKNQQRSFELRERQVNLLKDPAAKALALAVLYTQWDKLDKAMAQANTALASDPQDPAQAVSIYLQVLSRAGQKTPDVTVKEARKAVNKVIQAHPDQSADMLYEMAMFLSRMGDEAASEKQMLDLLAKYPDHPQANNGLGYTWADKGVKLNEALKMIQKAVKAEPDSPAYLDSLGWVYYKLGQFDKAVQWLTQATQIRGMPNPVILDHLGDAYYRSGNTRQAIQAWRQAQRVLGLSDFSADPDAARLPKVLREKIESTSHKRVPSVAPIAKPSVEAS